MQTQTHDTDPAITAAADTIEAWLERQERDNQRAANRACRKAIREHRHTTRSRR